MSLKILLRRARRIMNAAIDAVRSAASDPGTLEPERGTLDYAQLEDRILLSAGPVAALADAAEGLDPLASGGSWYYLPTTDQLLDVTGPDQTSSPTALDGAEGLPSDRTQYDDLSVAPGDLDSSWNSY